MSHPAYLSSTFILRGGRPDAVILQHAPSRRMLGDFPDVPMPTPAGEIRLIECFADTKVIGLTINHESMTDAEVTVAIEHFGRELGLPVTDALSRPAAALVDMVLGAFPGLAAKSAGQRQCDAEEIVRVGERELLGQLRPVAAAYGAEQPDKRCRTA